MLIMGHGNGLTGQFTRREMVERLLAAMSVGAVWPLTAKAHPIFEHFGNEAILFAAEKLRSADWNPVFLSPQQNETLLALAETIVPGSTKAEVNRFIDLLLSVDKKERQREFVESLAAFNAEAQKQFQKDFTSLHDDQKNGLLTNVSLKPASGDVSIGTAKTPGLYEHFENLKGWIAGAYYSSEEGIRELGWTGDYAYAKFPGCEHPEGHP